MVLQYFEGNLMFIPQLRIICELGSRKVNTMNRFRVLVGGKYIKMDVAGDRRSMGFFVTRFVEAATPDLARASAIATVRADARLDGLILNDDDDPPLLFVDEVEEVSERDVPEVEPRFVFFKDEDQSASSEISPPPYLMIRKGVSFWVENRPLRDWTATPQAFDEGCFCNAYLYDTNGVLWQIVHAKFKQQPSFVNTLLPWRQLPVVIEISSSLKPAVLDVLAELVAILESVNSFSESFDGDPGEILQCLKRATTPTELIQYAGKCV